MNFKWRFTNNAILQSYPNAKLGTFIYKKIDCVSLGILKNKLKAPISNNCKHVSKKTCYCLSWIFSHTFIPKSWDYFWIWQTITGYHFFSIQTQIQQQEGNEKNWNSRWRRLSQHRAPSGVGKSFQQICFSCWRLWENKQEGLQATENIKRRNMRRTINEIWLHYNIKNNLLPMICVAVILYFVCVYVWHSEKQRGEKNEENIFFFLIILWTIWIIIQNSLRQGSFLPNSLKRTPFYLQMVKCKKKSVKKERERWWIF